MIEVIKAGSLTDEFRYGTCEECGTVIRCKTTDRYDPRPDDPSPADLRMWIARFASV